MSIPQTEHSSIPRAKVLVTAGPTIEPLDPVRFISNRSTGLMGYKIAAECAVRGFEVCLVSGPVALEPPRGVETVNVLTAIEMRDVVLRKVEEADCLVMTAAVCDFRPYRAEPGKIKKKRGLTLELVRNPDILADVGRRKGLVKVGFALETEDAVTNAAEKMAAKDLDLVVVNMKTGENDPFGPGDKTVSIIDTEGRISEFGDKTKEELAAIIVDRMEELIG